MPSGYLHQQFALDALRAAGFDVSEQRALIVGAHGPDPLFMMGMLPLRLSSRPGPLGNVLHTTRTGAFLCALCALAKDGADAERAYAMGFLTHYALDSTVHPYVYGHSAARDGTYSSARHLRMEKRWDQLFFRRDGGRGTPLLMPGLSEAKPLWPEIASLLAQAIRQTYPERPITQDTLLQTLRDAERVNQMTHSPTGVKYAFVWALERLIGKPGLASAQITPRLVPRGDLVNAEKRQWYGPAEPDRARDESLAELYDFAKRRAALLLTAARRYFDGALSDDDFAAIVGNAQYDTGMTSDA